MLFMIKFILFMADWKELSTNTFILCLQFTHTFNNRVFKKYRKSMNLTWNIKKIDQSAIK